MKNIVLIAGIAHLIMFPQAFAETTPETAEPMALHKIMEDMGKNMQTIVDGISHEDWVLVEKTAPLIANHPQPPMSEKKKIMAFFAADMSKFKSYDTKTHDAARVLGEVAAGKDGQAIISNFATLQNTCLMCHQNFRESFKSHFYGMH